jgi:hypothetical protein
MKIYRLQHKETHRGPYNNWDTHPNGSIEEELLLEMKHEHSNEQNYATHPGAWRDEMNVSSYHKFGFDSLEKLYAWFENYIDYLLPMGYEIIEYEISWIFVMYGKSGLQIAFNEKEIENFKVISK